jgi:hypothetical protein
MVQMVHIFTDFHLLFVNFSVSPAEFQSYLDITVHLAFSLQVFRLPQYNLIRHNLNIKRNTKGTKSFTKRCVPK